MNNGQADAMFYETKDPHGLSHNPFKSLVVPRPIGWISSRDPAGRVNLAPFSFFNAVAENPPVVMFSAGGRHLEGGHKDTPLNVEATGEFVFNQATWELRDKMNLTSATAPRDWDEFALAGLTPVPARLVDVPMVKESPVHFECRYLQTVELPAADPEYPTRWCSAGSSASTSTTASSRTAWSTWPPSSPSPGSAISTTR